jgi:hypothetical protein
MSHVVRFLHGVPGGRRRRLWIAAVLLLSVAPARGAEVPRASVVRTTERIRLDGVLDEGVWRTNPPIGPFLQAEPDEGKPPREPTDVWLAYDDRALYIAVRSHDREPAKIFTTTKARDARPFDDDSLEIVIDTFLDRRNGYYFQLNAAGSLSDGRIVENRLTDVSWDGIWDAQTRIDGDGWVAEIEIPFKTLSFNPDSTSWGFNIERTIARYNEESRWAGAVLDSTIHAVSRGGVIDGLEGLTQGIGLDVKPYGLLGVNKDATRADQVEPAYHAGVDAFYRITANLLSSTTVNTDFAETEVDTRQVNLTRFPTLYPEKRAFFVEEAGVFQFGLPSASSSLIPFFSRRIGLVSGQTVPILVGEKLTGKVGRLEMGFLDVATRDSEADPAAALPGQNFVVGRVKYSLGGRQSYVGAIFTSGEPTGTTDNTLYGGDLSIATSNFMGNRKNFDFTLYGLKTRTPGLDSRDYSYGAQVRYPNDRVNLSYSWQDIGENFDPRLGYVRRRGVVVNSALAQYRPRTTNNRFIRQFIFSAGLDDYLNTVEHDTESRAYSVSPFGLLFHGGERLSYTATHEFERLFEPFQIHSGITIPIGAYSNLRHAALLSGPTNKVISYSFSYDGGGFYSGSSDQIIASLTWKKSASLTTSVELRKYWVRLAEGNFNTTLTLFRLNLFFTPKVSLTNFAQYDTDSRNIGLQSRLRWILKAGQELYVVFNHQWQEDPLDRFETLTSDLRGKVNYTVRF